MRENTREGTHYYARVNIATFDCTVLADNFTHAKFE